MANIFFISGFNVRGRVFESLEYLKVCTLGNEGGCTIDAEIGQQIFEKNLFNFTKSIYISTIHGRIYFKFTDYYLLIKTTSIRFKREKKHLLVVKIQKLQFLASRRLSDTHAQAIKKQKLHSQLYYTDQ